MSSIGQILAMVEENAPETPRLMVGQRVNAISAGVVAFEATIESIRGAYARIRDDDGNVYSAAIDCLEPVEETGETA